MSLEGREQPLEQESLFEQAFEFPFPYGSRSVGGGNSKTVDYRARAGLSAFAGGGADAEATDEPGSARGRYGDEEGIHNEIDEAALLLAADSLLGYGCAEATTEAHSPACSPEVPTRDADIVAAAAAAAPAGGGSPVATVTAAPGVNADIARMMPVWGELDNRPLKVADNSASSSSTSASGPGVLSQHRCRYPGRQRNQLPTSRLRFSFDLGHLDLGGDDLVDEPLPSPSGGGGSVSVSVSVCNRGGGGGDICGESGDRVSKDGGAGGRQKWSSGCGGNSLEVCADGKPTAEVTNRDEKIRNFRMIVAA